MLKMLMKIGLHKMRGLLVMMEGKGGWRALVPNGHLAAPSGTSFFHYFLSIQ